MLDIKNSKYGRYKILKVDNKKYLLDTFNTKPNFLLFLTSPQVVQFRIVELPSSHKFDKEDNAINIGTTTIVFLTMPLVTFLYEFGKSFFILNSINNFQFIKILFFIGSVLASIFLFLFISYLEKVKCKKELSGDKFDKELTVKTNGKKNYLIFTMLFLIILTGGVYLTSKDGTEAVMLVISSIITFGFL